MGVILVCDITKENALKNIFYWLSVVKDNTSKNVSLALFANKCDLLSIEEQ